METAHSITGGQTVAPTRRHAAILRQCERLQTDLLSREAGVALTCLLFATYLPLAAIAAIYAICIATELVQFAAYRILRGGPSRLAYAVMLGNSAFALAAFSLLGLLAWQIGDEMVRVAAVIALVGALLNVSSARAADLSFGVLSGLPPALTLLGIAMFEYWQSDGSVSAMFLAASIVVFLGYFGSALHQNHMAQTRLADARAMAEAASRAKSRFLGEMSHEVRTPLNTIAGLGQALRDAGPDIDLRRSAEGIEDAARQLETLIGDVLDLAAAEEGTLRARAVTTAIRRELRYLFGQPNGGPPTRVQIAEDVPELARFDAALLRRLLRHLAGQIGCATDGQSPGCAAEVRMAAGRTDRLVITLRCPQPLRLGDGPHDPPRTRTDTALSGGVLAGGVLAGLAAERLGAALGADVATAADADGAPSVTVTLPVEPVPDPPVPGDHAAGHRLTALVIDDIGTNRFVVAQLLRLLDIEAHEAESGPAALERLRERAFDVVLLDMNMPTMDGEATFRAIRGSGEAFARVPVIALTADALSEQRERYLALGLDGYVPKPVDKRLLWAEIAACTGRAACRGQ